MSFSAVASSLQRIAQGAKSATGALSGLSQEMDKVAEQAKKPTQSLEDMWAQMEQLQIFAGTMSSSFTKPLLDSFKKGEISSGEFRKQLEILLLKLKEIRALGNVGKQGYGSLDQDKGDIEKILGEMDKNMGGRRP